MIRKINSVIAKINSVIASPKGEAIPGRTTRGQTALILILLTAAALIFSCHHLKLGAHFPREKHLEHSGL